MTDNRFPHAHTVIDRGQRRIPHLAGALVRQDVEALVELAREQADELDRIGRARLALAAVRLIATESVTEDAGLLRRAILEQLPASLSVGRPQSGPQSHAEAPGRENARDDGPEPGSVALVPAVTASGGFGDGNPDAKAAEA